MSIAQLESYKLVTEYFPNACDWLLKNVTALLPSVDFLFDQHTKSS